MSNEDTATLSSKSNKGSHPIHIELPDPHSTHIRDDLPSPLSMEPGAIDGLMSIKEAHLLRSGGQSPHSDTSSIIEMNRGSYSARAEMALAALQYLPTPLIVLDNSKIIVLSNDAMGRLMSLNETEEEPTEDDEVPWGDKLKGKTLSQIGVDVIQDGR